MVHKDDKNEITWEIEEMCLYSVWSSHCNQFKEKKLPISKYEKMSESGPF